MNLQETAKQGDRLETLRALRDSLAADLDACESMRDKAALSQRLMDTLVQIEDCEKAAPPKEATALDELRAKRASRATKSPTRASRAKSR